ncbi:tRNA lysidine(34) synthetase TilS [Solwaraspora sp. WMMD1047]|uniref:tRNA lysidine(34) synthetase TilS n=1 Tax=Solwaraspora sp. WMMD1047 TaxID=3016102 RepID=UPI002417E56B|nr:tRNA lysidine(34) synthetase TilS [Solwaraspora sp. WMMD1047]MDG4828039.1 tRNA lysidine(34) synthetase TilS [Solwaraspora sp. WMMD1047]
MSGGGGARAGESPPGGLVLVACSGGADSLALAAGTAFVARRLGRAAGLVTVDHGLQAGSAARATDVLRWAEKIGLAPAELATVTVAGRPGGPEAAAREARYQALVEVAHRHGASAVLLGHTRDDQAETVLLALARGAGPRGIAGMPERRELAGVTLLRPLLAVSREQTRQACAALGLTPWDDPHNADPRYRRARVRSELLPALVGQLGPGVVGNLARTASLVAADNAALDELAAAALQAATVAPGVGPGVGSGTGGSDLAAAPGPDRNREAGRTLAAAALAGLPAAIRTRVLHAWARELGAAPGALSHRHVEALDALVTGWRGQGPTQLPGGIVVSRRGGTLLGCPGGPATEPAPEELPG